MLSIWVNIIKNVKYKSKFQKDKLVKIKKHATNTKQKQCSWLVQIA